MDKNEIVRRYKWFRVLRGISEMFFSMLLFYMPFVCIPLFVYIFLDLYLYELGLYVLSIFFLIAYFILGPIMLIGALKKKFGH